MISLRRHHLGHVDAALGVGVAVVAVLITVWLVAAVVSSPNSRFTSLDAAVSRSDILHSIDNIFPSPRRSSATSRPSSTIRASRRSSRR